MKRRDINQAQKALHRFDASVDFEVVQNTLLNITDNRFSLDRMHAKKPVSRIPLDICLGAIKFLYYSKETRSQKKEEYYDQSLAFFENASNNRDHQDERLLERNREAGSFVSLLTAKESDALVMEQIGRSPVIRHYNPHGMLRETLSSFNIHTPEQMLANATGRAMLERLTLQIANNDLDINQFKKDLQQLSGNLQRQQNPALIESEQDAVDQKKGLIDLNQSNQNKIEEKQKNLLLSRAAVNMLLLKDNKTDITLLENAVTDISAIKDLPNESDKNLARFISGFENPFYLRGGKVEGFRRLCDFSPALGETAKNDQELWRYLVGQRITPHYKD